MNISKDLQLVLVATFFGIVIALVVLGLIQGSYSAFMLMIEQTNFLSAELALVFGFVYAFGMSVMFGSIILWVFIPVIFGSLILYQFCLRMQHSYFHSSFLILATALILSFFFYYNHQEIQLQVPLLRDVKSNVVFIFLFSALTSSFWYLRKIRSQN